MWVCDGKPQRAAVRECRSEVNTVNLVSLLAGSMDPAPTIGSTRQAIWLTATLKVGKERKRRRMMAALFKG